MPITEIKSPGVFGIEKAPARAPEKLSPAKMGIVGWTQKGPSDYPVQVRSIEEFTRVFGATNSRGVVPQMVRAFFGTGGERAWVSRAVPADAVAARIDIDSAPGPTKWSFVANGEGTQGNDLKVRIRGNRNFLNPDTHAWDKFDVLILQPADFNPAFDEASETYEQVQFTDPTRSDYILNVVADPRKPSLLVTLLAGAGGTPASLLPVSVTGESIGTGGGSPLASNFTATLANVPALENTVKIRAVQSTTKHVTHAPTAGAINGTNTSFTLQLTNLPVVEGSTRIYYQKPSVANELLPASSGAIDGANQDFVFNSGVVNSPVHREATVFRLKYGGTAAAPQTLSTTGGTPATYSLAGTPLATTPVHPGTVSISVNVNGVGLATITDDGAGVLAGSNGALPLGGTIDYDTGAMTGTTAVLVATSTVVANYRQSNVITKRMVQSIEVTGVGGAFAAGDVLTQGAVTGVVISFASGVIRAYLTAGTTFVAGAITGDGPGNATVTVAYFSHLEQAVPLTGSVDGAGVNTIDLVADTTLLSLGSGEIDVKTAVAPAAGTFFYADYVPLGHVYAGTTGTLSGDATTTSTMSADTGLVTLVTTVAPRSGSTINVTYQTGQFVYDNGLGALVGDVDPDGTNTIDYNTGAIDVTFAVAPPSTTPLTADYTKLAQAVQYQLEGGLDGTVISRAEISHPDLEATKSGIYALDLVEEPLNIVVPDFEGSAFVQADIVDYCDAREEFGRFAIFSMANGTTVPEAVQYVLVTQAFDTKNAAIYYPNIYFLNDSTELPELLPASGFVAGVFAKTAANKNIGKTPAGVIDGALDAPGIVGPEFKLSRADQDNLFQSRINTLPSTAASGFYVNGGRSLSKELRWRYVNARQLHNYLMYTTKLQLEWTVHENNGPGLWQKITTALDGYYSSLFRLGYFAGQSKAEAFFIKCDGRNNNQTTIDQGKVIIDIGFSPSKPAEFVTFYLSQPAGPVSV